MVLTREFKAGRMVDLTALHMEMGRIKIRTMVITFP
jgi:hypothetical protein